MSKPIVSTSKIAPVSGELKGTIWTLEVNSPLVIKYSVSSSGNDTPYIYQKIDWGDGAVVRSSRVPIGRNFQSQHAYDKVGEYLITLGAINTANEECDYDANNTIRLRVVPLAATKQPTSKWRGLALPLASIADNFEAINDTYISTRHSLASDASAGEATLVIAGDAFEFEKGAQITVVENNKLLTSGNVLEATLNVVTLNVELVDNYTRDYAVVEVIRQNLGRTFRRQEPKPSWYFPISTDAQLVKAEMSAILATRLGERVMLRDFGSRVHELVFEQNDPTLELFVRRYIISALEKWAPRVEILRSDITRKNNDLSITLAVKHNLETFEVDYNLNELLLIA